MSADAHPDPQTPRSALSRLETRLGHRFENADLLTLALTHRSAANEQQTGRQNERLEFLGDAVLGLLVAESLYRRYPNRPEGGLARAKATLVSAGALAPFGESVGLGSLLRLGVGESRSGGRRKTSLLADAVEAVLGAVYLDGGIDAARVMVERYLAWSDIGERSAWTDPKTELQELVQAQGWPLPSYEIVATTGPEHDKRFRCEVAIRGQVRGRGDGASKKEAQQSAAAGALEALIAEDLAAADEVDGPETSSEPPG